MVNAARGKEIMQDAVVGMLLVFGASMILRTVNPDTLTLRALDIQGVVPGPFLAERQAAAKAISLDNCTPNRGAAIPALPATCGNGTVTSDMRSQALSVQAQTGVPAYLLLGIYGNETSFQDKNCPNNNCGGIKCNPPGGGQGWVAVGQSMDCGSDCALEQTKEDFHDGRGKVAVMACFKKFPDVPADQKYAARLTSIAKILLQSNFDGATSWRDYQGDPNCAADFVQKKGWATASDYASLMQQLFKTYCLTP